MLQGCRLQSDRKATPKAAQKSFFSRVSEATLGSFSGHFWDVLGAKLGGVSASRVYPSVELLRVAKLQGWRLQSDRKATPKAAQKLLFSRVSEATLGSFSGHFSDVLGAKLGVSAFRVVSISRAVARCKVARLKAAKRQESDAKGSEKNCFFSRVSEATLGSFSGHFWDVLGAKLGVSAFRVVSISRAVARCNVARLQASKRQESYAKGSPKIVYF